MKSRTLASITVMTLFATLAIPVGLSGQKQDGHDSPAIRGRRSSADRGNDEIQNIDGVYHDCFTRCAGNSSSFGRTGTARKERKGKAPSLPVHRLGHSRRTSELRRSVPRCGQHKQPGDGVGVADTATPDPYYPNFNPLGFFPDPFVHHVFKSNNGSLVDLGALPGANSSSVSFITESGLISGQSLNGAIDPLTGYPEQNAVLWKNGHIINLGTLGGYESGAGVVNSHGQIAGFSGNAVPDTNSFLSLGTQTRAFLWDEDHGMQDLGTLGGSDAFAPFINERGEVAGLSYTSGSAVEPFLWKNGKMVDLGTLGGTFGGPGDLNNHGQVAGTSNLAGDSIFHPFLWTPPGPMRDLGTLGGNTGSANAINDAGEVVGLAETADSTHAFFWSHGQMTDVGAVDGDCFSGAFGINAKSQVVGQSISCDGTVSHAFLWENGHIIDLNNFVPPGSGLVIGDTEKINDRGEIFGSASLPNGDVHAVLLIPCDEDHPGVEGCDYNEVEAPTEAPVRSAQIAPASAATSAAKLSTTEMMKRYRFSMANRNRWFGALPLK